MAVTIHAGKNQFFASDGSPLASGKLYTYVSGTSTPKAAYTDAAGTIAHANPIVLDSRGEAEIYWTGVYDVTLKTSADVTIWGPIKLEEPESDGAAAALDTALRTELANTSAADEGDTLIGVGSIVSVISGVKARHASLHDAVTAIGANRCTVVVSRDVTMSAGATFPSTATLRIENGARITTTGYTLTAANFDCDPEVQCFSGTGTVVISSGPLHVAWWGEDGSAIAAAIAAAKAGSKELHFVPGKTYTVSAQVDFLGTAIRGMRYHGHGCTIYRSSGAGPVATLDSGGDTARCDDIEFIGFVLRGNASSDYGLDMRGIHRSKVQARVYDVATAGFRTKWSVLTDHNFTVSDNIDTFSVNPATGLLVTQSSSGNYSAANKYHVVMEGPISSLGVDYEYGGLGNIFTGSCEDIPRGFRQRSTAADAILLGMDFEGNSVYDILAEGRGLKFVDSESSSSGSSPNISLASTCSDFSARGGFARQIDIDSAATSTTINDMTVSDNVSLGITGTGSTKWRGSGNVKVNTSRVVTATIPDQLGAIGSYTATLTGVTTVVQSSIAYRQVGDMVTLFIPAMSGTSNATTATLTGMPADIRPASTQSVYGTATNDNSGADVFSKVTIDSSGVITLFNGLSSSTFTASGSKGVKDGTITYKV